MSQTVILLIALTFGTFMVLFENWYSKYRSRKTKNICEHQIPKYGFEKSSDEFSDYNKIYKHYSIALNLLKKKDFVDRHTLRLIIDFDAPVPFSELNNFVDAKRKEHLEVNWVGNCIFKDFKFYWISDSKFKEIESKLDLMIELIVAEDLKPISRDEGRKQGEHFDDWQMEN